MDDINIYPTASGGENLEMNVLPAHEGPAAVSTENAFITVYSFNRSNNLTEAFSYYDYGLAFDLELMHRYILQELEAERRRHSKPQVIALMILYTISFLTGLVGNSLVLFTVAKFSHMRTVTNAFLANLAVCDLLVVLLCMPISLGWEIYMHWIYGPVICRLVPFIQGVCVSSSMLTLTAVSLNRYYAIRKPLRARSVFTKRTVTIFIAGIWTVSVIIMAPLLYTNDTEELAINGIVIDTICSELHWPSRQIKRLYGILVFLFTYFIPLLFTIAVYLRICQRLWNHDQKLRRDPLPKSKAHNAVIENQLKGRRKVVKMLLWLVSLFAVSWLPFFISQIYLDFVNDEIAISVHAFFLWLGLSNSSINPICYCFMSERFKNCFRMICCCPKFKKPRKFVRGGSSRYAGFSRSKSTSFFRSGRTESIRFSVIDNPNTLHINSRRETPIYYHGNGHAISRTHIRGGTVLSDLSLTDLLQRDDEMKITAQNQLDESPLQFNNNGQTMRGIYQTTNLQAISILECDERQRPYSYTGSDISSDANFKETQETVATSIDLQENCSDQRKEIVDWESSI
ncbi:QRFP-like peptide receptor [Saccoglossus kowalevskii]|uniref:Orexin receptor type 2-like n=1 Tax=Saccoglossus kowalevskii TaxID=10224 RepID=A0ABM0M3T7_SACKO|nr:PREDICTED: orexin receptor type 2-like [Saccoglossus kowalevskii]